jgi:retron-type reverse transcriptase
MAYKQQRNDTNRQIRLAKRTFFVKGAKQGSKSFWKNIKQCAGVGRLKQMFHPWPCGSVSQATASANKLNTQFINSVTILTERFLNNHKPEASTINNSNITFNFSNITPADVACAIRDLPNTNSHGDDDISAKMLRLSASAITRCLASLFNSSIQHGIFPDAWKTATVVPVFKKGDIFDMGNYRPISLINLIGKIFEKIICLQITDYLDQHALLSNVQHGFRKGLSCETALLRLSNLLFTARRNKQYISIATIDYTKAFDCINFDCLLQALKKCGFSDNVNQWFSSYLHGRSQRVKYYNSFSAALPISSGVPQGSVASPLLFNIFINPLLQLLSADNAVAYADDITLIAYGASNEAACQALQSQLNIVSNWSHANGLTISPSKCFVMHISAKIKNNFTTVSPLYIGTTVLPTVASMRILGVTFTNSLNWSTHNENIRKKIASMTGVIHRFGRTLNADCRNKIVKAFVLPHLRYCVTVWGNSQTGLHTKMNNVLLRTVRIIMNNKSAVLDTDAYKFTGIFDFNNFVKLCNVCRVFNIVKDDLLDYYLNSSLVSVNAVHITRNSTHNKIVPITSKRAADCNCFQVEAIKNWNDLDFSITSLSNFNVFKSKATAIFV